MGLKRLIFILLVMASCQIQAEQLLESRTVSKIFAENGNHAGFYTSEGLTQCLWGIMFIDLSTEAGKAQLSMVLAAKLSNQKIVRMDYTVITQKCWLSGLHIQ